jgi:predicted ATP-binding protein involved in virulence
MKLKSMTLANYRGFDQIDLGFEDDVTVIAGVNGVGKSGLLQALATLMSHGIPKFCVSQESPLVLANTDIQNGKNALTLSSVVELCDATLHVDITRSAPLDPSKAKELTERRDELRSAIGGMKKNSKEALEIQEQLRQIAIPLMDPSDLPTVRLITTNGLDVGIYTLQSTASRAQPIAVLYSTARLFSRLPPKLSKTQDIYLSSAYSRALTRSSEISLNDFANWYRAVSEGAIQMPELAPKLMKLVQDVLFALLPRMSDLQLHTDGQPRFSVFKADKHQIQGQPKAGKRLFLAQLSDGEQGFLALALDLLRRLAIANPFTENPVEEGSALILIDEIELHLHPKWQRDVLHLLRSVFKKCQFVVTTHSPLVLGEVEARCVRFLEYQDDKVVVVTPAEAYGMDANRILQEFMGTTARNKQMNAELKALFELIDDERFAVARAKIITLQKPLGENEPELTRATSLIKFLEGSE